MMMIQTTTRRSYLRSTGDVGLAGSLAYIVVSYGARYNDQFADFRRVERFRAVRRVIRATRAISLAAIVVAVVLGVLWMSQQDRRARPVEPTPSTVEVLSDFTLPDLEDQPRSITEWSGRSLVINFWATWCPPCRREMPLLQSLQDEHTDGSLQVIGVALDNLADVKRFIAESNITYPILYGEHDASTIAESFGDAYIGLPFSVFVAPRGEILALWTGELFEDDLSRLVAEFDAISSGRRTVAQARERLAVE